MEIFDALPYAKLKLKIDYPELNDTWLDGYESAANNYAEEDNPFAPGSEEFQHWSAGWWAGFYEEPVLFNFSDTPVISSDHEIISRIEKAGVTCSLYSSSIFYDHLSTQSKLIMSYIIQWIAALMAFSVCYQFADFFA